MSDSTLPLSGRLSEARSGSREALGTVLDSYRHYLLGVANRHLSHDLATKVGPSDLVQETFLEAYRDFARFRGQSDEEVRAWLRCLLLHHAAKLARCYRATGKRQLSREVPIADGSSSGGAPAPAADLTSPSQSAAASEQTLAIFAAISRLDPDHRRVVQMRYVDQRPFDEIAAAMGRSPNAVMLLWYRAVRSLRCELGVGDES